MKVAFVASEVYPFAKTGGLADVAGALPIELHKLNCDVKIFLPFYTSVREGDFTFTPVLRNEKIEIEIAQKTFCIKVFKSTLPNSKVETYFVDFPKFYNREELYTTDYDEHKRWILFNKAVIEILQKLNWQPNIIHCNDWQCGLIPYYLKHNKSEKIFFQTTSTLFTIHNIGYQGLFDEAILDEAEIAHNYFYPMGPAEYYGSVSFLKLALEFSDIINTVSQTYAKELLTDQYGGGMQGILKNREKDFYGILNGVDYNIWNPEKDKNIFAKYSSSNLEEKEKNKIELLKKFNLPYSKNISLIGIIARMVSQKGYDIIAEIIDELVNLDLQWIILGNGEPHYEKLLEETANKFPNKLGVKIGYSNSLAHQIEAGADYFLMPSMYEPCGLNQIYSLKYGTIPIVRKTGGLADTVTDWDYAKSQNNIKGNGFSFEDYSAIALLTTIKRAINHFNDKKIIEQIRQIGMEQDFSWKVSATKYLELYRKLSSVN